MVHLACNQLPREWDPGMKILALGHPPTAAPQTRRVGLSETALEKEDTEGGGCHGLAHLPPHVWQRFSQPSLAWAPWPPSRFLLSFSLMGLSWEFLLPPGPTFWLARVAPACPRGRCCPCANARWWGQVPSLLDEGLGCAQPRGPFPLCSAAPWPSTSLLASRPREHSGSRPWS